MEVLVNGENTANKKYATFEVGENSYVIKFNEKRIELYENSHMPIVASFIKNGGALSVSELKALTGYGLCIEGGQWVNPKTGLLMANDLLLENGYMELLEAVMDALERDCGFLFPKE